MISELFLVFLWRKSINSFQRFRVTPFSNQSFIIFNFLDEFTVKVKRNCQTLALLIYHKESLIKVLAEYIVLGDPLSIQPILE